MKMPIFALFEMHGHEKRIGQMANGHSQIYHNRSGSFICFWRNRIMGALCYRYCLSCYNASYWLISDFRQTYKRFWK